MRFDDYFDSMQTIARYGHALDAGVAPFTEALIGSREDPSSYRSRICRRVVISHGR